MRTNAAAFGTVAESTTQPEAQPEAQPKAQPKAQQLQRSTWQSSGKHAQTLKKRFKGAKKRKK